MEQTKVKIVKRQFKVIIRYFSNNKWHETSTKWYNNASEAWKAADEMDSSDWLESSRGITSRKVTVCEI